MDYEAKTEDPVFVQFEYTHDFLIILQDWFHETEEDLVTFYTSNYDSFPGFVPRYAWPSISVLMNGRGQFDCEKIDPFCTKNIFKEGDQCLPSRNPFFGKCETCFYQPDPYFCSSRQHTRLRLVNSAQNLPLR